MSPRRLQLEGRSLDELKQRVLREHGRRARIVAAEKVTVGGIRGFFAREHFEVTVEIPDPAPLGAHILLDLPARVGIAALLSEADETEAQLHAAPGPTVSTSSEDFAAIMDELTLSVGIEDAPQEPEPTVKRRLPVPKPLSGPGDLIVIVGLRGDALAVARSMAASRDGAEVSVAGMLSVAGLERVDDRRDAMAARARGVERDSTVFVAFGLGRGGQDLGMRAEALGMLSPDQLWVAVDAGRKVEDTAHWVRLVSSASWVDAVAVEGTGETSSPQSVNDLELPIGWVDGAAARASRL